MAPVDKHPTFQIRHRRRSSSVADSTAADLAARRPRRLSSGARRAPPGVLEKALERPQLVVGAVCAGVFLLGCAIAVACDTAVPTSELHHVHNHAPLRAAYFARKSNAINVLFVKRAWAWTAGIYLLHLSTSPGAPKVPSAAASVGRVNPALHSLHTAPRRSRGQRLAALVLASLAWILFTAWCFGAGLGDRIIAMSGGTCAIPLPKGIDVGALEHLLPDGHTTMILHAPDQAPEHVYLPLHDEFCGTTPLAPHTHPRLFALLDGPLQRPRWSGGFDISGHAFLLTLGAIVLAAEVAPSWRAALAERRGQKAPVRGPRGLVHAFSTVAGSALIGLWVWMLLMTALYFHNLKEKLAGLGLGLLAAVIVNLSIPGQSAPVIEFKVRGAPRRPRASPMSPADEHAPVFSHSRSESSDDAPPLSPTPVRSPGPTVRRLDAVAALEDQAQRVPIIREPIPEKLHQE
ncbi:hypothetical protein CC85DRAFT_288576 [Cutaneotrichosporon oleaginosum]|uniref:Uncharacterized protein n=1 Tax=Cutaneotrichosporon oleaginosum TaxID=879819 RepID=A0A0J0XE54_9TREE|nr:uncharacterized protein CC85DRAFT_288576 [Cutaneotrichosporon oleaginosum]KLT39386.1 hypothetical protein CC85DRAFT_288576 [Cutaneotrichosporon oleaginosum]TXT07537.1 hypothetical protein COLE_04461 [Cutaneotrichosporon oleaginosum]